MRCGPLRSVWGGAILMRFAQNTMLRLHSYFRSSASYRVRMALALKGLNYEVAPVNLREDVQRGDTYRALNPEGLVPLLEDGGIRIAQSMAIMEYLEERFPTPALLPNDPVGRARVRGLAQLIACDIHPLNNLRVLQYLIGPMEVTRSNKDRWYAHWITQGMAAVERRLAEAQTGAFCHGDHPGMADCVLVPQVANAQRMQVDLSDMPRVLEITERCQQWPAFQLAHPSLCPDATGAV